jgi:hypothetical protein
MENKQTAVEWLMTQAIAWVTNKNNGNNHIEFPKDAIKQAKEMEKEQIIDAHLKGQEDEKDYWNIGDKSMVRHMGNSMEYYEKTYGGKK